MEQVSREKNEARHLLQKRQEGRGGGVLFFEKAGVIK